MKPIDADDPAATVEALAEHIRNDDVHWDGTLIGLSARVSGDPAQSLQTHGAAAMPPLLHALGDPARFVAAHVLLTQMSGMSTDGPSWNGLQVELPADGNVRFDPAQRDVLARRWQAWAACRPRPVQLPDDPHPDPRPDTRSSR